MTLVTQLSGMADRLVIGGTGLAGQFDWEVQWIEVPLVTDAPAAPGVSLYTAVQEQLGLKLNPSPRRISACCDDTTQTSHATEGRLLEPQRLRRATPSPSSRVDHPPRFLHRHVCSSRAGWCATGRRQRQGRQALIRLLRACGTKAITTKSPIAE
jgi:hypothetical protein